MSVSDKPWGSFTAADYTPEQYCSASLIDLNASGPKVKGLCKLPVHEPSGALNRNGVHAAAAVLAGARGGVDAPPAQRRAAARRLVAHYRTLNENPPPSVARLAAG